MEKTVPMSASARMERIVTTSLGSALAELDLLANSVSKVSSCISPFTVLSFISLAIPGGNRHPLVTIQLQGGFLEWA